MSHPTTPRALVVGLGSSGVAAAALLVRQGWRVTVNDRATGAELADRLAQLPAGVASVLGSHPESLLEGVALVVTSPGVPPDLPLLTQAKQRGIEVIAELELAYRSVAGTPLIAVTGSNGKTTVTALLGAILDEAGWSVGVGGNIGLPASAHALEGSFDALVWEVSSFQLEGCTTLRPRVGVLLNLSPDHLDRHPSLAAYLAAKTRLFARQQGDDVAVLNADDQAVAGLGVPARVEFFSLHDRSAAACFADEHLVLDGRPLLPRSRLPLLGEHNVANALAAALAAARVGAPRPAIAAALERFTGLPHRHTVVAEVAGVRYVDDSKGTNIGATAAGLAGYRPGTVHLILGGLGKGQDFAPLAQAVAGRAAAVYLIGEAADEIARAIGGRVPVQHCGTLVEAVRRAAAAARAGDTVLLSPACASFDQFRDYTHRGEEFARLAHATAGVA
jgi:UDP-N-acetylmuramoylalanine--D-glutamate ligase